MAMISMKHNVKNALYLLLFLNSLFVNMSEQRKVVSAAVVFVRANVLLVLFGVSNFSEDAIFSVTLVGFYRFSLVD